MEIPRSKPAQKFVKPQSAVQSPPRKGVVRYVQPQVQQATKSQSWSRDELKERQGDKLKVTQKLPVAAKENTKKPQEIKLHTEQRAARRALFNYTVATKLYLMEQHKRQVEKLQKMIEEEEVRMLRKEMIPRAQLMPFFDRPFFPQRSSRPLTVPREPSFHIVGTKCSSSISCS
ncbi:microtubule-destabilizing protein 60 isoform X4 [Diospyros lotus]|uniref:microtubule-destabilizing protein 60 isoform X1 n=1 Tax=Diospyros lotus TaxID=55363 RepID=UPI0022581AB9|nr:microtubule-destabilizing protein 60 isoform X1 [Diospyros lotus]XP_052195436.1 microtubule-destabilizing protein 60 isoform X2 [Diospyros lotus]XP_052195437.1 microtubule-destabilizing protein 60 isoform X3 [Diospyros lotus]XP_052195438.1 microtubule-destabilizing protein 60 isoform X4 [Diospyros lotus]